MSLYIVLVEPEIPHNTGAIARSCALTKSILHLVKPLGFSLEDKYMKRAGLDYWPLVDLQVHEHLDEVFQLLEGHRFFFATTKTSRRYSDIAYEDGDVLVFGKETKGLPEDLLRAHEDTTITIPMREDLSRSLNLANACNIILFEALRQLDFPF